MNPRASHGAGEEAQPMLGGTETRNFAGRYTPLVRLGDSELATTHLARDTAEERQVVVRVPKPALLEEPSFAYLLEREGLELLRVRHPHIVRVLDSGRHAGAPFFVTEYVEGQSLAHHLAGAHATQSPTEIYGWLLDVAEALDFIHAKKKTHREVRPAHILFGSDGRVSLTDFVLGSAMEGLEGGVAKALPSRRRPGLVAPEVDDGGRPTPASDLYALAATAYLALTGTPPPRDPAAQRAALTERVSAECADDLLRALHPDPAQRFPSCYEFARAFGLERKRPPRHRPGLTPIPGSILPGEPLGAAMRRSPEPAPFGLPAWPREGQGVGTLPGLPAGAPSAERPPAPYSTPIPAAPVSAGALPSPSDASLATARCWRVRMGPTDQYARQGRDGSFIAVDWSELGDLRWLAEAADAPAMRRLVQVFGQSYGVSGLRAGIGAGQVWRFVCDMVEGDVVVVPNPQEHLVHVGRVQGRYAYQEAVSDSCRLPRRRAVTWLRDVPYGDLHPSLVTLLSGPATVVDLEARADLVRALASPGPLPTAEAGDASVLATVVAALYAASLDDFVDLLRTIFVSTGYDAEIVPGSTDETWEAMGTIGASGFADVLLRTWVRRSRRDVGIETIFESRGALSTDEQGAIVALGGFTAQAQLEASAHGKKPIRLIDGPTLAAMALERWEQLPPQLQGVLGVERVERARIEVRFRSRPGAGPKA